MQYTYRCQQFFVSCSFVASLFFEVFHRCGVIITNVIFLIASDKTTSNEYRATFKAMLPTLRNVMPHCHMSESTTSQGLNTLITMSSLSWHDPINFLVYCPQLTQHRKTGVAGNASINKIVSWSHRWLHLPYSNWSLSSDFQSAVFQRKLDYNQERHSFNLGMERLFQFLYQA